MLIGRQEVENRSKNLRLIGMEAPTRQDDQRGEGEEVEEDEGANEKRPFKRRGRKRTSRVWEAFCLTEDGVRVCNHCDKEFGMTTSTTSLRYHLEREHEIHDTDEDNRSVPSTTTCWWPSSSSTTAWPYGPRRASTLSRWSPTSARGTSRRARTASRPSSGAN